MMQQRVLVTGGAGFIGSAVVRYLIGETKASVLNVDKLTYAGNLLMQDQLAPGHPDSERPEHVQLVDKVASTHKEHSGNCG